MIRYTNFLLFLIAVLLFCIYNSRLKERYYNGGDYKNILYTNLNDKDKANRLLTKINEEFGSNPILVASKIDTVLNNKDLSEGDILQTLGLGNELEEMEELEEIYIPPEDTERENFSTLYECPRCGARKTSVKEILKRASDEPTNIMLTCQVCGFRFDSEATED